MTTNYMGMLCAGAAMAFGALNSAQAWENTSFQVAALAHDYALTADAQRLAVVLEERATAFLTANPNADPEEVREALLEILFGNEVCAPQREASLTSARLALAHMSRDTVFAQLTVAAHGAMTEIGKPCAEEPMQAQRETETAEPRSSTGWVNIGSLHTYVDQGGGGPDYVGR